MAHASASRHLKRFECRAAPAASFARAFVRPSLRRRSLIVRRIACRGARSGRRLPRDASARRRRCAAHASPAFDDRSRNAPAHSDQARCRMACGAARRPSREFAARPMSSAPRRHATHAVRRADRLTNPSTHRSPHRRTRPVRIRAGAYAPPRLGNEAARPDRGPPAPPLARRRRIFTAGRDAPPAQPSVGAPSGERRPAWLA